MQTVRPGRWDVFCLHWELSKAWPWGIVVIGVVTPGRREQRGGLGARGLAGAVRG